MSRPLRVLMVNHAYVRWMNRRALSALAEQGDIEVHVLAPRSLLVGPNRTIGLEVDPQPTRYHLIESRIRWSFMRGPYYDAMARVVREVKPDVIFVAYEPGSLTALQAVMLARLYHCKLICFSVDNLYPSLSGETRLRLHRRHWVGAMGMGLAALMERLTIRRISYLLTCNEEARQNYHAFRGYGGPSDFIPLGVDLEQFHRLDVLALRQKLGLKDFVIGYFGRLSPEKGIHLLIEAAAGLEQPFYLLIDKFVDAFIEKEYLEQLIQLCRKLGIAERVVFFDAPHEEMPDYMNCVDCVVLPSVTTSRMKEQYGRVIVEAMACELPVIGSTSGAIPDMLGNIGLIFPEGDVDALRGCLTRLMNDAELRLRLGLDGRQRAKTLYSIEIEVETYRRVFESLTHFTANQPGLNEVRNTTNG